MARTTFSGPVASTAGFEGDITGDVTGDVTGAVDGSSNFVKIPAASAADIADATAAINTANKSTGTIILDSNNGKLYVALGNDATSAWYLADGSASVTPS